jgi:hypothetical protein
MNKVLFYFKVTSTVIGITFSVHISLEPENSPKERSGLYLEMKAKDKEDAAEKLKKGPFADWQFVSF